MKRFLALLLTALLLLTGCARQEYLQEEIFCMDTVMSLKIWGPEEAMDGCREALYGLQNTWSATREDSLISRLNRGEAVALTEEERSLLEKVEALSARTGGAFDPCLGALCEAWGFYGQSYRVPDAQQLAAALDESKWDMGASIKGYSGNVLVDILKETGAERAVLNMGGNVQTFGEKKDGSPWLVAVQDPFGGSGYACLISVTGTCAVVTSGDYQRYFEENGVRYHHILDPKTGYPADSGLASVTVVCRDGLTADALSTALFVMGLEEGSRFWRESEDFEAVFILKDGTVCATEGAQVSGCEYEVIRR